MTKMHAIFKSLEETFRSGGSGPLPQEVSMDPQQAAMELTRLINGFQISRMIQVVASLGVADLLKDAPRSYDEIAAATGAHPRSMYRLLHALERFSLEFGKRLARG